MLWSMMSHKGRVVDKESIVTHVQLTKKGPQDKPEAFVVSFEKTAEVTGD